MAGGRVIWLTGLTSCGKTVVGEELYRALTYDGDQMVVWLDDDSVRTGFCRGLGWSEEDRLDVGLRVADVADRIASTGIAVIVSVGLGRRVHREQCFRAIRSAQTLELYLAASLSCCRIWDSKGWYLDYDAGVRQNLLGVDLVFEEPLSEITTIRTDYQPPNACVLRAMRAISTRFDRAIVRRHGDRGPYD